MIEHILLVQPLFSFRLKTTTFYQKMEQKSNYVKYGEKEPQKVKINKKTVENKKWVC